MSALFSVVHTHVQELEGRMGSLLLVIAKTLWLHAKPLLGVRQVGSGKFLLVPSFVNYGSP